jgi:hypothetical protein
MDSVVGKATLLRSGSSYAALAPVKRRQTVPKSCRSRPGRGPRGVPPVYAQIRSRRAWILCVLGRYVARCAGPPRTERRGALTRALRMVIMFTRSLSSGDSGSRRRPPVAYGPAGRRAALPQAWRPNPPRCAGRHQLRAGAARARSHTRMRSCACRRARHGKCAAYAASAASTNASSLSRRIGIVAHLSCGQDRSAVAC